MINNTTSNTYDSVRHRTMELIVGDVEWAIEYPDGSLAIGIEIKGVPPEQREACGRLAAKLRAGIMREMGYEILAHGWMKPRNINWPGAVIVYRKWKMVR